MDETTARDADPTAVEWRRLSADPIAPPVVRTLPYLECKLEHPGLEPDGHGDGFFPDAVPYELDGTARVFYWRPALDSGVGESGDWGLACATTRELVGVDSLPTAGPPLVVPGASGTELVVDGTIAGETTTCRVASYAEPDVTIEGRSESAVEVTVDGSEHAVPVGERRRIPLAERRVEGVRGDGGETEVAPELVVRYPGRRELHHPARGATYRLFPSFGLDLGAVPNPLSVPTAAGELDHDALAAELGVDPSRRPYPERVLWQAFAYTAFDPHGDATPELAQLDSGHVVVRAGSFRDG